jgi:hypothetical protein
VPLFGRPRCRTDSETLTTLTSRLVDEITYVKAAEATDVATQSAILGPFFREDHPVRQKGDSISFNTPKDAEVSNLPPNEIGPGR